MLVLSTNGFLLKKMAKGLKNAGLSRVNVSLDSLKSDRVLKISQKDALKNALEGIEESLKVGLKLKLNTVVMKSVNDDEILELLEYAKNRRIQIRYIAMIFANLAIVSVWLLMARFAHAYTIKTP
ncbi:hypothetical protein HpCHC93_08210 [Helicobacter pylori]|nr:hypothetical protein VN0219_08540 [Helicobacter pylori]